MCDDPKFKDKVRLLGISYVMMIAIALGFATFVGFHGM